MPNLIKKLIKGSRDFKVNSYRGSKNESYDKVSDKKSANSCCSSDKISSSCCN